MTPDTDLIRADRFALALSSGTCWSCHRSTRVAALVVGSGHTVTDEEDTTVEDEPSALTNVRTMNPEAEAIVTTLAPWMAWSNSKTAGVEYWGNRCEHCAALQGDHHLHSEPGGPFFPMTDDERQRITMTWIETPLSAEVGGRSMGVSWLD